MVLDFDGVDKETHRHTVPGEESKFSDRMQFIYTVVEGDEAPTGIAIPANSLDAMLVRSVLALVSMEMLGRGNWYLPSWLACLPDVRVEPAPEPAPEPAGE